MKKIPLIVLLFFIPVLSLISQDIYQLILIDIKSEMDISIINSLGLDVVNVKPGLYIEAVVHPDELAQIKARGLNYEMVIENMSEYYRSLQVGDGVFGDYLTYSEALNSMDSLHNAYPSIVSPRIIIPNDSLGDTTWDGNYVWAIKVSDNVDIQESEPEALIIALHHAREPITTSIAIYFLHWLADNYGTDPEATWLVDNRQIWIIPVVNPDGYIYNETHGGYGGMWRKNRRNNGGGEWGVDPNRNYTYKWGYDNTGSSPYTWDETYRGPYAGSEPCIQSVMNFYNQHEFVTSLDYHSYSRLYLYPWGYVSTLTPDNWKFDSLTHMMAVPNGYTCGTVANAIYPVNGGSVDWGYGDITTKPKIFHISPEVGTAFWQDDQLNAQLAETHLGNKIVCWAAGLYLRAQDIDITTDSDGNGEVDPGDTVDIIVNLFNYALDETGSGINIYVSTDDPYVYIVDHHATMSNTGPLTSVLNTGDPLTVIFDPLTPEGYIVELNIITTANNDYISNNNVNILVGTPTSGFFDDFESGSSSWTLQGIWQLRTNRYYSPSHSLGTGPYGNYQNISATMSSGIDFPTTLSFWTVYDLENGYDYGYVEISSNENPTWTGVATFNGEDQWTWSYQEIDLSTYSQHHNVKVRFRLDSDSYITGGGWYVDDVLILTGAAGDSTPTIPVPLSPANGASVSTQPVLCIQNSTDPNGLPLTYSFRVYSDSFMTDLEREETGVAQGTGGQTSWQISPPLGQNEIYYWRVYADNGYFRSQLSQIWSFITTASAVEEIEENIRFSVRTRGFGTYFLSLPAAGVVNVDLIDISGRILSSRSIELDAGQHRFSEEDLPQGLYFLNILFESQGNTYNNRLKLEIIR